MRTMQFGIVCFMLRFWESDKEAWWRAPAPVRWGGQFLTPAFLLVAAAIVLLLGFGILTPENSRADVPQGDEQSARSYYRSLATTLGFSSPDGIFQTTLADVASYL